MRKSNIFLLDEESISLLKKVIGNKILTIYSDGSSYGNNVFVSSYFSLLIYSERKALTKKSNNYIRIFSDYYLLEENNYYKMEIFNDKNPYKIRTNEKGHLIYPFVEITPKGNITLIEKIEIYKKSEEFNTEKISFDCGIVFTTIDDNSYLISVHQSIRGGVEFIEDRYEINKRIDQWELRTVLE